jgi:protein-S-isoprenylcysteine O-methyltransferase Ste14
MLHRLKTPNIRINEAPLNQSSPRTSLLHRAINLVLALALVVVGGGGLVYVYFIDTSLSRWVTVAAAMVGAAGLYWLWEEYKKRSTDVGAPHSLPQADFFDLNGEAKIARTKQNSATIVH